MLQVAYLRLPTDDEILNTPKWSATTKRLLNIIKTKGIISNVELQQVTGYKLSTVNAQISIIRRLGLIRNLEKASLAEYDKSERKRINHRLAHCPLDRRSMKEEFLGEEVLFRRLVEDIPSTTYATFGLYRYPAKFIPQVIAYVLKRYGRAGMRVFDPFAGYGTVGIVSRIYGCDYELWDLNPLLGTFHEVATLEPKNVEVDELLHKMDTFQGEFIPRWSRIYYWFPEEYLPLLFNVWGFYHSLDDTYVKLLLTIPLLKTSRYFSYDDMQRQKLSKSPKSRRRVESLLANDWRAKFFQMVGHEIRRVLKGMHEYWALSPKRTRATIKSGVDALSTELEEDKDILITSPPYLQSQEYIRQAKIDMFWLGYSEAEVRRLSKLEIPYRHVEAQLIHSETFSQWEHEIEEDHLRKVFDRYFWGVLGALTRLQQKVRSRLFLFVGRASMRGRPVPIDRIFAEHFTSLGWAHEVTMVDTIVARQMFSYRINPATGLEDNRTPTESLVILRRKP